MIFLLSFGLLTATVECRLVYDWCSTPQWEAVQGGLLGSNQDGVPQVQQFMNRVSYDLNNTRVAISTVDPDPIRHIMDYKTNVSYTVIGKTCVKQHLDGPFRNACIPRSADYSWDKTRYGFEPENSVFIQEFRGTEGNLSYIIQTTYDHNPLSEWVYGNVEGESVFAYTRFMNLTWGIRDPSVFKPPPSCDAKDFEVSNFKSRNIVFFAQ